VLAPGDRGALAACRARSGAWDMPARRRVRGMRCRPVLSSAPSLRSTGSAAARAALLAGFPAAMEGIDFSRPCIICFGLQPSRCGPARPTRAGRAGDLPVHRTLLTASAATGELRDLWLAALAAIGGSSKVIVNQGQQLIDRKRNALREELPVRVFDEPAVGQYRITAALDGIVDDLLAPVGLGPTAVGAPHRCPRIVQGGCRSAPAPRRWQRLRAA